MFLRLSAFSSLIALIAAQYYGQQTTPQNPYGQSQQGYNPNYRNEFGQNQNYNQNQQFGQQSGRGVVNQFLPPINTGPDNTNNEGGVTIQFQLRGYSNPTFALTDGRTCVCPSRDGCNFMKEAPYCSIGFNFIISSPDESVRYFSTDFTRLDNSGSLTVDPASEKRWDQTFLVQMDAKPSAIDIFASHIGAVFYKNGTIFSTDALAHADTWVVPLNDELPSIGGMQSMSQPKTFTGKATETRLSLSYSIACTGSLIGPECDLTCTTSPANSQVAACRSNSTGFFSVCRYQGNNQVNDCKNCPWGIKEGTYCQSEEGGVLDPHTAGVVDTSYKTATIGLGITCAILLILLILAILLACLMRKKAKNMETIAYKQNASASAEPLLATTWGPTPAQRSQPPSLDARPAKSSLKKPLVPDSVNNTRDTSFSHDVPVRPSRSEIV